MVLHGREHMSAHEYAQTTHTHLYKHTHKFTQIHRSTNTRTNLHTHSHILTRTHTHTHTHTHTYTHTHTHTHTHTQVISTCLEFDQFYKKKLICLCMLHWFVIIIYYNSILHVLTLVTLAVPLLLAIVIQAAYSFRV